MLPSAPLPAFPGLRCTHGGVGTRRRDGEVGDEVALPPLLPQAGQQRVFCAQAEAEGKGMVCVL